MLVKDTIPNLRNHILPKATMANYGSIGGVGSPSRSRSSLAIVALALVASAVVTATISWAQVCTRFLPGSTPAICRYKRT